MVTASAMARSMALGADWCNSARAFMFAVGCIQSQRCHTNQCPVGVTTQDPKLQRALIVAGQVGAGAQLPPQHRARAGRDDRGDGARPHQRARARTTPYDGSASSRPWPSTRSTTWCSRASSWPGPRCHGSRGSGTRPRPSRSGPGPRPRRLTPADDRRGPAPGGDRRRRLRRAVRCEVPAAGAGAGDAGRPAGTTTCSSRCSTSWRPGSCPRARWRRRSGRSCATTAT